MIQESIDQLGKPVRDVLTGFTGVITCVSFDVNGCVQGYVQPAVDKDGKKRDDGGWYDVKRLVDTGDARAMNVPDFAGTKYGSENGGQALASPYSSALRSPTT